MLPHVFGWLRPEQNPRRVNSIMLLARNRERAQILEGFQVFLG